MQRASYISLWAYSSRFSAPWWRSVTSPLAPRSAHTPTPSSFARLYAECNEPTQVTPDLIEKKIRANLKVKNILVQDSSGNGSFFMVAVQSPEFRGLSMLKQHKKVNDILKEELKMVHGITLKTLVAEEDE